MKCHRCQHENETGAKFCEECAAPLARACAQCGRPLSPTAKFCPECAHPTRLAQSSAPADRFDSPESYTPKHLAERILTSRGALEGERKQVTILFADLKGSMELLADRDPEEARRLLDPVLERMMEAVHHYEGTVNQVMGDGIMALFGAPIGHEDHAIRACYAAIRMQRRVTLYADEVQRKGGTPVQIRVGVNSGEVVVRAIGSDLHMDYTAVGQTTHLAARMEQLAKPGSVLITGDTLALAEGFVQVRPLGAVPVKGLEAPTPVYELTGVVPARSRFQASAAARGLTHFVGRESELQQLGQALERAAAGHGQAVAIVGEAGLGKSRLTWEFTRSHRTHGWLVLESGSVSYGKATPYLPVIDLLKDYFRIQERDDPRAIRERVAGKLLMLDRALEPLLTPPLLALLDVPVDDAVWDALDPAQRRQRTLEAVQQLLLRESQIQPLLVVFEDLHWIDSETQALLDGLMERLPTARLLLLVNYRPEYEHAWNRKTYYRQLRIDPLPPESADALLHALLGDDRTLAPLRQVLIQRTEGNPFFLEESVRALVETQVLVGERGAYRLAKTLDAWQIPASAQAILAARIDRLAPDDKRLLQAAAVIGKDVPFTLLHAIADLPETPLRRGLANLQAAEFLYETSLFPDLEYTFKHALTHEVAYGSVLQDRRRTLHVRIVEAIETLYCDRLTEQIERLAHHAVRAELWEKAAGYLRQAGDRAAGRSAYQEAVTAYEEACVALEHRPGSREVHEQAIDLRLELRDTLQVLNELDRVLDHLSVAERLAESIGDDGRLGRVAAALSNTYVGKGQLDRAIETGMRALRLGEAHGDVGLQVSANARLGAVNCMLGDYRQAVALSSRALELIREPELHERFGLTGIASIMARFWLVRSLIELGLFAEAATRSHEAIRIATSAGQPFSLIAAHVALGELHIRQGNLDQAVPALERAVEIGRTRDLRSWMPVSLSGLGHAYAVSGRVADAILLLEESVSDVGFDRPRQVAWFAEAHLRAGRSEEATRLAGQALELARSQKAQGYEAWALRLLGEIGAHVDPLAVGSAAAGYQEALALAQTLGMRPLIAHSHLGLGTLYRRTGDGAKAQEHLTTAATMYREMGMGFWLGQAEAALGPPHGKSP
jgi:class 3 adenylate cyclase/tetratricopeptide (TPR) repeat protein